MRKTKISHHSNVDTDIADYDDHYLESLFAGRMKSGIIYLGPGEMASKHKIRVDLKIGTKNTRIGVPRELEGWMKTTLYRDNTTLRWILFCATPPATIARWSRSVRLHVATCKGDH